MVENILKSDRDDDVTNYVIFLKAVIRKMTKTVFFKLTL